MPRMNNKHLLTNNIGIHSPLSGGNYGLSAARLLRRAWTALDRIRKSDVHYRFGIGIGSLP